MYPLLACTPYRREFTPKKYWTWLPHKLEDNMQISVKWLPSKNVDCRGTIKPEREYQMMFLSRDSCVELLSGYGRWPFWCSHPSALPPPNGHQKCFGFILPPLLKNKLARFEQCLLELEYDSSKQINNILLHYNCVCGEHSMFMSISDDVANKRFHRSVPKCSHILFSCSYQTQHHGLYPPLLILMWTVDKHFN